MGFPDQQKLWSVPLNGIYYFIKLKALLAVFVDNQNDDLYDMKVKWLLEQKFSIIMLNYFHKKW